MSKLYLKTTKWKRSFAFFPLTTITGKRVWFKKCFIRATLYVNGTGFETDIEVATLFELLARENNNDGIFNDFTQIT